MYRDFVLLFQNKQPCSQGFSVAVHFSGIYAVLSTLFSTYRERLSNLVIPS